ncbi:hypothetical protein Clacol_009940 [Clathrus columnatus]|uniref:Nucleolar pre-ribosomal-associated protein 1 n=1 Tax=Clathrus columnatus TaxID=1419009 RepID=A0AAV5ALW1_9AGAM|nr:hypothetical protein Clacol_009940 [Clathrus columnatus]
MVNRPTLDVKNESVKRPRHTTINRKTKFSNVEEVLSTLRAQDAGISLQGLKTLRNQLYFDKDGSILEPQDERLFLARSWLERSPSVEEIFHILEAATNNPNLIQLCFDILASLLDLLSTHSIDHPYGLAILKVLLSQSNLDTLNSNISNGSQNVILSALKLFSAMSDFGGGAEKRAVMDGFTWGQKANIRTAYINFILSFLSKLTPTTIKMAFLEQHKDIFLSIFKGIDQDPHHVIRHVLETSWEGIWNDNKLKRTIKVALFQERTLLHLLKLYDHEEAEGNDQEHAPANVVHHFLLAIMTHPGFGICFRDRGWYAREESDSLTYDKDHQDERSWGNKIYNKILSNILKPLKVNESPRQQELVFKILQACPELISGYWTSINLTLEPRLSSRWITNISILGTIISSPVPIDCFILPNSVHINPAAPPLRSIMANVLPTVLNRTYLTKGLQSTSNLVQLLTGLTLTKCLIKLDTVLSIFKDNSLKLEEDDASGKWLRRAQEVQKEAERRVPDVMVIIGIIQRTQALNNPSATLLSECVLRLLWLYQKLFPRSLLEIKFDTGKLLETVVEPLRAAAPGRRNNILHQLHILRFLTDNDQFSGLNKMGSSHSQLYGILLLHARTENLAMRGIAARLSNKVLSSSILFMHDPAELDLWLQALPRTQRGSNAKTSDGIPLSDETIAILTFLDDCIQRCSKTPYRYLDELHILFRRQDLNDAHFAHLPSPLLVVVLEQLKAKISAKLLNPSDALALITFIRKLGVGLITKLSSLDDARIIQLKLNELVSEAYLVSDSMVIQTAFQREFTLFSNTINFIENPTVIPQPVLTKDRVADYNPVQSTISDIRAFTFTQLTAHENVCHKAYEIIDGLRFTVPPPSSERIKQLLPFELCDIHTSIENSLPEDLTVLSQVFYSNHSWNKSFTRRLAIALNRLKVASPESDLFRTGLLRLIEQIADYGMKSNAMDVKTALQRIFVESDTIRDICYSTTLTQMETRALSDLLNVIADPTEKLNIEAIKPYCIFWENLINDTQDVSICLKAEPWIPYMQPSDLIHSLDLVLRIIDNTNYADGTLNYATESILFALSLQLPNPYVVKQLQSRIGYLLSLSSHLSEKVTSEKLVLAVLEAGLPTGYNGLLGSDPHPSHAKFGNVIEESDKRWHQRTVISEILHLDFLRLLEDIDRYGNSSSTNHELSDFPQLWSKSLLAYAYHPSSCPQLRSLSIYSLKILSRNFVHRTLCATWLVENTRFVGPTSVNPEIIRLLINLKSFRDQEVAEPIELISQTILEWVGQRFADEEITTTTMSNISLLIPILQGNKFKSSVVEQIVKSAIRNHLDIASALQISTLLVRSTDLKPMVINQLLQSIVQHSRLYLISDLDLLTELLYALFLAYPANTCQPSHVIPLLRLYQGTMAIPDIRLFSIFQLYERQTKQSVTSLFNRWTSSRISTPSQNIIKSILTLDSNKVFRTCLSYPKKRSLSDQRPEDTIPNKEYYDPLFIVLMASQFVLETSVISVPDWVQVFRTNIFSVVISALSSKDDDTRRVGMAILGGLQNRLQDTGMIESNQVLYVLNILKNSLQPNEQDVIFRLPNFITIFMAHALRSIFYPSSFLYSIMSRFLLQRPEFDITDVPLLYSLLYSTEDGEWIKHRTWMIRYLTQVMDDGDFADWKILRRRHTWDLIASMWQASKPDERAFRRNILELITNMTANQYAIPSLVLRSQIVCWIEMQLKSEVPTVNELLAWLKILENIVVVMDFDKAEKSLSGTYADSVIRCLTRISNTLGQTDIMEGWDTLRFESIYLISRTLLRISEKGSTQTRSAYILKVAEKISSVLFGLESVLEVPTNASRHDYVWKEGELVVRVPHKVQDLPIAPNLDENGLSSRNVHNCRYWAVSVVFLWRVTMKHAFSRQALWDNLTHRGLPWTGSEERQ